jgi:putative DNA primase/helicase
MMSEISIDVSTIKLPEQEVFGQVERYIANCVLRMVAVWCDIRTRYFTVYQNGRWEDSHTSEVIIDSLINNIGEDLSYKNTLDKTVPYQLTKAKIGVIKFILQAECKLHFKEEFDNDRNVINFRNGVYNLKTGEFKYHLSYNGDNREYLHRCFIQIPHDYDPNAECIEIAEVISEIITEDDMEDYIKGLGNLILPSLKYGKAIMLYGQTGTGKTTLLNIIIGLIGKNNTSELSLHSLGKRFQSVNLKNKKLNVGDDIGINKLVWLEWFRKICTNRYLSGEPKGKANIQWENHCKMMFSCNELPKVDDREPEAFWKRWLVFPCFHSFKEDNTRKRELRSKQYSEEEYSGLINICLEGIKLLEEDDGFSEKREDSEHVKEFWFSDTNAVNDFYHNFIIKEEGTYIFKKDLKDRVNVYRKNNNLEPIGSTNTITRELKRLMGKEYRESTRKDANNKVQRVFLGITYIEQEPEQEQEPVYTTEQLDLLGDYND